MRLVAAIAIALGLGLGQVTAGHAADGRIAVVAAENAYGDIARQVGGDRVAVTSILSSPNQDPHLFETAPGTVRTLSEAQVVVINGADYDPWMEKVLKTTPRAGRAEITAATLLGRKPGDNPHLWYDLATMPKVASALADAFSKTDPAHANEYAARLKTTLAGLARIDARVAQMKTKFAGQTVTATEPVFGLLTGAIGLTMRNDRFQLAMMNDTEPSARDVAAMEDDLRGRKVKALIYNSQVTEKLTERLRDIAMAAKVPVVGVTETMPAGTNFQDWVLGELDALDKALSGQNS
jgi:zinc/manganese transport system substrate-binding protein